MRKCIVPRGDEYIYLKDLRRPDHHERYTAVKLILHGRFLHRRLRIPASFEAAILWHINDNPERVYSVNDTELCRQVAKLTDIHDIKRALGATHVMIANPH
jgi:hypothetical protein